MQLQKMNRALQNHILFQKQNTLMCLIRHHSFHLWAAFMFTAHPQNNLLHVLARVIGAKRNELIYYN